MTRHVLMPFAVAVLVAGMAGHTRVIQVCRGFLPENDLHIAIGSREDKGIDQEEFNEVLDSVEKIYGPIMAEKGAKLVVNRYWSNNTVNASAQQWGRTWIINMYGGLARHAAITQDGFALVACHEISHHLGGAPKMSGWATIEGQSDYAANLKCLRRVFSDVSSAGFTRPRLNDPIAVETCDNAFSSQKDRTICLRSIMAGKSVTALFKQLHNETKDPQLDTPDPAVVTTMYTKHPGTQCRLDTFFQGAQCTQPVSEGLSDNDLFAGTCNRKTGQSSGLRPRCWYKPPADEPQFLNGPVFVADASDLPVRTGPAFAGLNDSELWRGR